MASYNIAQIQGLGQQYGQSVNNDQAQALMNQYSGGNDVQGLTQYFQNQKNQDDVKNAANQAQTNFNNLQQQDTQSVTDFLTQFKGDTANAISSANNQFNIPGQTDMVNALNSRINDLSTNMSNSGAGGFSNANQVDAAINSRYLPQLNTATTNLNTSTQEAQQQEGIALQPDTQYAQLLSTNITAGMSGLTNTEQTVLQGIIANLNAGVSLTQTQMQVGEQLAQQAMANAAAITTAQIGQQFQPLSAGSTLTNTRTGEITNPGILAAKGVYNP